MIGTGLDASVRRISTSYDALDRVEKVTNWDNAAVGSGSVVNEVQYEYEKFGVVKTIYEEHDGAVSTSTSEKVSFTYQLPTDGTTALRLESTTYPSGEKILEIYTAGMDATLSRPSGRDLEQTGADDELFRDAYLGMGRLVERTCGDTSTIWTLVGTDSPNQDNYIGLDRFARIDDLVVRNASTNLKRYLYEYNYRSQITVREDKVGNIYGYEIFDEIYDYDDLGRLIDAQRGSWNGSTMSSIGAHECWTLDRSGNADKYQSGTSATCTSNQETDWSFNKSNEITENVSTMNTYTYDNPGNLVEKEATEQMVFDAWGRLMVDDDDDNRANGVVATYEYDGLGQKIERRDSTGLPDTDYFYNGGWQLIEEQAVSDGSLLRWYVQGTQYIDDMVVRADGTTSSDFEFQVQDARFNVVARLDNTTAVVANYVFDAYGLPTQKSANYSSNQTISEDLHLFHGRAYHKDHAQYEFRRRWEDPELGTFVSRDPIGVWGGMASFGNGYGFGADDPGNRSDPSGLDPLPAPMPLRPLVVDTYPIGDWAPSVGPCYETVCCTFDYALAPEYSWHKRIEARCSCFDVNHDLCCQEAQRRSSIGRAAYLGYTSGPCPGETRPWYFSDHQSKKDNGIPVKIQDIPGRPPEVARPRTSDPCDRLAQHPPSSKKERCELCAECCFSRFVENPGARTAMIAGAPFGVNTYALCLENFCAKKLGCREHEQVSPPPIPENPGAVLKWVMREFGR